MPTTEARLIRLEERFRAFEINSEKRDREINRRMSGIEAMQRHLDENTATVMASLQLFINPMRWLKNNWIAVGLIGGAFTLLGGAGVGSALKLLSKFLE